MKILAIERDIEEAEWNNAGDLLKNEARHVFELYLSDTLREIYFTENKNEVLLRRITIQWYVPMCIGMAL